MNQLKFSSGETFLVIGIGRTGLAVAEVLSGRGATLYAIDEGSEIGDAIARIEKAGARFIQLSELDRILAHVDCAVLSPGVPLQGKLVQKIAAAVPVLSEIEVGYRLCSAPIAAITGTKGKSTTTALLGHILQSGGRTARVCGNIGNPLIREAVAAKASDWVAVEVSSFQLEATQEFHPRISSLLNISPDHLDRYPSFEAYAQAKYRIFANQTLEDTFVGNLDNELIAQELAGGNRVRAQQLWFSAQERPHAAMYVRDGWIVHARGPQISDVIALSDLSIAGPHNVQNAMAASLMAMAAGLNEPDIAIALRTFKPLEHRLQPIAEREGVLYVDDSKATNPASVIAALRAYDRPVILIAGGRSKNTDFAELGAVIDERAKSAILIGEAANEIAQSIKRVTVSHATSIEEAVRLAHSQAKPGEIVLLSPGCASFDMFTSAEERGAKFIAAVNALPEPAKL